MRGLFAGVFAFLLHCSGNAFAESGQVYRAPIDADGVQRAAIIGGDYFFLPEHILLRANVPAELLVRAEPGIVPHNFVIDAPGAGMEIEESLETTPKVISFTPTRSGKYPFYCDKRLLFFKSHREKGMEGLIEVEE